MEGTGLHGTEAVASGTFVTPAAPQPFILWNADVDDAVPSGYSVSSQCRFIKKGVRDRWCPWSYKKELCPGGAGLESLRAVPGRHLGDCYSDAQMCVPLSGSGPQEGLFEFKLLLMWDCTEKAT